MYLSWEIDEQNAEAAMVLRDGDSHHAGDDGIPGIWAARVRDCARFNLPTLCRTGDPRFDTSGIFLTSAAHRASRNEPSSTILAE
jgi:hypothetical protein